MREIWERNNQDLKAGRPPMPAGKRIKARLAAALKHDAVQVRHGGFGGPYQRKLDKERKEKYSLKNIVREVVREVRKATKK